jgi:hypothetical protein
MARENETPQSTVVEPRGGPGDTGVKNMLERVTVNLTPRSVRALNNLVGWTDYSKTDTINRALQIYAFIQEILEKGGSLHVRQTEDAELERLKFF